MAKYQKRLQASALRRQGESIRDIAKILNISKGTASLWCQEIALTTAQKEKLAQKQVVARDQARLRGAATNQRQRLENVERQEQLARVDIGKLTKRDLFLLGVGLYWGEGAKSRNGTTAIINSDPAVILCALKWFEICLGVVREDFRPYVYVSEIHKGREEAILKFWSTYLNIPRKQFLDIIFLKGRPKKVYENYDMYYGVIALRVRRGTELKYRILGLIKACKDSMPV